MNSQLSVSIPDALAFRRPLYFMAAKNNSEQDFEFSFYGGVDDALIEGLDQNRDFFTLLLENEEIKRSVLGIFTNEVYTSLRAMDN